MTIEFRRFREDELEQAWEMDQEAFNSADSDRERFMDYVDPPRMHGAFVSGRAVAMTNVLPCVHYFGGRRVEAGGVSSVTVAPDYRGQAWPPGFSRTRLRACVLTGRWSLPSILRTVGSTGRWVGNLRVACFIAKSLRARC